MDTRSVAEFAFGVPTVLHVRPVGGAFDLLLEEYSDQGGNIQTTHTVPPWGSAIAIPGGHARVSLTPQTPQLKAQAFAAPGRPSVTVAAPQTVFGGGGVVAVVSPPPFATLLRVAINGVAITYSLGGAFGPPLPPGGLTLPPSIYQFAVGAAESLTYAWEITR
jgi:hypothetical protein